MKKLLVLTLAVCMLLVGATALAYTNTGTLDIGPRLSVARDGAFTFAGVAYAPTATGVFWSAIVTYTVETNQDFKLTVTINQFNIPGTVHYLPTIWQGRYRVAGDPWPGWTDHPGDLPYTDSETVFHAYHQGFVQGQMRIRVERNGLADFFGTYTATMTVVVSTI